MKDIVYNILYSGHTFTPNQKRIKNKFLIMNNILFIISFVATVMSIFRFTNSEYTIALMDISLVAFIYMIVLLLRKDKKYFNIVSNTALFIGYVFITLLFNLASDESSTIGVFFVFLSIVVILKGRLIGFYYLVAIIVSLTVLHLSHTSDVVISNTSFLLLLVYISIFYALMGLYKNVTSSQHDNDLNSIYDLEYVMKSFNKRIIFSKTDLNGKITYVNEAFCNISGYKQEELIGRPHSMVRHPDMAKNVFEDLWADLQQKKYWHGEIKNKKKTGGYYWVDAVIEAYYDSNGKHVGYQATRQDITSKKEVEKLKFNLEQMNQHLEAQNDEKIIEVIQLTKDVKDTQKEIIFTMGTIGEIRSKETGNHVKRVAEYTKLLAVYSGMHEFDAEILKQASPMHDIGKIGIPDAILNKPGRLTEEEMEIMKTHAELGYDMLKHSDKALLGIAAKIAHEHHEKYDGSGYPNGLKGENISIEGRITAVADVFDALGSDRKYKKAWADEDIFKLLVDGKGKHFDPELVDVFIKNKEDFFAIRDKFVD